MSVKVEIYRYDLTNGMASQMAPMLLGRPMEGVWHTSIVINGHEYYFDGGVGIDKGPAGRTRFGPPLRSEVLGFTTRSVAEFETWNFQQMASNAFGPNSYNLMLCNCNHYSQAACQFLLSKDIPDDIRNMIPMLLQTPLGAMVAPILQQMASGGAGIGATPFGAGLGRSTTAAPPTAASTTSASASASTAATATTHATAALDADTQESLDIYLALIASDDANNDAKTTTLDALERIFTNIRNNPANQQYQRLSVTSDFYKNRIAAPFEVAQELLLLAGFEMDEGTHMVFRGNVASLTPFILAVQKSKASI